MTFLPIAPRARTVATASIGEPLAARAGSCTERIEMSGTDGSRGGVTATTRPSNLAIPDGAVSADNTRVAEGAWSPESPASASTISKRRSSPRAFARSSVVASDSRRVVPPGASRASSRVPPAHRTASSGNLSTVRVMAGSARMAIARRTKSPLRVAMLARARASRTSVTRQAHHAAASAATGAVTSSAQPSGPPADTTSAIIAVVPPGDGNSRLRVRRPPSGQQKDL